MKQFAMVLALVSLFSFKAKDNNVIEHDKITPTLYDWNATITTGNIVVNADFSKRAWSNGVNFTIEFTYKTIGSGMQVIVDRTFLLDSIGTIVGPPVVYTYSNNCCGLSTLYTPPPHTILVSYKETGFSAH